MRNIVEAILNRKQTISDILSSPEEQLRLFNQAFRKVESGSSYSNVGIISTFKKDKSIVINIEPKSLSMLDNYDGFNVNFFELDAESWPFSKDIVFENIKQPITILFKGTNIDGFTFTTKKCKKVVFYVYEDQVMSNSSFKGGLLDSVIVVLKKGTDYQKQRLGLIYDHIWNPSELYDARFNPLKTEKWNILSRSIGNNNDFSMGAFHTKINIDAKVNPVDRSEDSTVQERQNNRNDLIEKIKQIGNFYTINLNQTTL